MSEEVVESTIVGPTGTGVLRKKSVKKRIYRDDGQQSQRAYGHAKDDYEKLVQRVLGEKRVATSVEVLQERWRMIMYMYDDCVELVKQWDDTRAMLGRHKRKKRLLLLAALLLPVVLCFAAWWLARCFW